MPINETALSNMRASPMRGDKLAEVLGLLVPALELTGAAEAHVTLDYQHADIEVQPRDLIPFVQIGLRQATVKQ